METYIFKVKVWYDKRTYRIVELSENQSLTKLHDIIQEAFDFDNDHLYAFFNWKPYRSEKIWKSRKVSEIWFYLKQKFWYLFDFWDDWMFEVEFIWNWKIDEKIKYPIITKSVWESPEQYGDEEDYEEEEEDEKNY